MKKVVYFIFLVLACVPMQAEEPDPQQQLLAARIKLAELQTKFSKQHPSVVAQAERIKILERLLMQGGGHQYQVEFKVMNVSGAALKRAGMPSLEGVTADAVLGLKGVDMLSAPRITTLEGQAATLEVVEAAPQYFEPAGDQFALKTLDQKDAPGIRIDTLVRSLAAKPGLADLDCQVSISVLEGRAKLAGIALNVGRPIIHRRELKTRINLPLGKWKLISAINMLAVDQGQVDSLVVLCRVERVDPAGAAWKMKVSLQADRIEHLDNGQVQCAGNVRVSDRRILLTADSLMLTSRPDKSADHVRLAADRIAFRETGRALQLTGSVEVQLGDVLVRGKELWMGRFEDADAPDPDPSIEDRLKARLINVNFKNEPLKGVLEEFHLFSRSKPDEPGINFILKKGKPAPAVTLDLVQVSLFNALRFVTEISGKKFHIEGESVVIEDP